jgi:hypothetical protein
MGNCQRKAAPIIDKSRRFCRKATEKQSEYSAQASEKLENLSKPLKKNPPIIDKVEDFAEKICKKKQANYLLNF